MFLSDRWQSPATGTRSPLPAPFGVQPATPRIFWQLFEASAKEMDLLPPHAEEPPLKRFAA